MIDINIVRNNPELIKQSLINRNDSADRVDEIVTLDVQRRKCIQENSDLRELRNKLSKEVPQIVFVC